MHNQPNKEDILTRFKALLAEEGLKSTRQRDTIVGLFYELDKHVSVDELLQLVREIEPKIGYATVYRTLKLCVEHGFAEQRDFGDGQTRFEPSSSTAHDHLICLDCRRVLEFDDPMISARIKQIVRELGDFQLIRRRVELYARCLNANCEHRE